MKKMFIIMCVSLFVVANAFSDELDISKGFFSVPWGASPEEAVRLLNLSNDKIGKPKYHKSYDKSIELKDATKSVLYFYDGRLAYFTRTYDMGKVPDAKKEDWIQVFKSRLSKVFKNNKVARFDITPFTTTRTVNGAKEKPEVEIILGVKHLQIEKDIMAAKKKAEEARKVAEAKEKEEIIDKTCKALLNL